MSNLKSDSIQISRQFLDSLVIEGRIIGSKHPTSKITVLGMDFETPIMTGTFSHLKRSMGGLAEGAKMAGAICSVGMGFLAVHCTLADIPKEHVMTQEILRSRFVSHPPQCEVILLTHHFPFLYQMSV